jgi:CDP-glucose 4,6-dehydratase
MTLPALFSRAFRGRKVFVTGHTGFKGSWLTLWLRALGADVTGYALAPAGDHDLFNALGLAGEIGHVVGDVRDLPALRRALAGSGAEVVFHLAAQPLVRESYRRPKETFDVNVGGTVNVLEAVREHRPARAFVNVTSDKCYDNREWVWGYREGDALGGADPYSASKGCAELVFAAYRKSFFADGPGLASARAGNVIGGGDWAADRIVPDCVRALLAGRPVELRRPDAVRPWQHVLEPLAGYLLLAARLLEDPARYGGAWNFGPAAADCRPVRDVAEAMVRLWRGGSWRVAAGAAGPPEAGVLRLCCDKAVAQLGWSPVWDFGAAVAHVVAWYREYAARPAAARELCLAQLGAFGTALEGRWGTEPARRAA